MTMALEYRASGFLPAIKCSKCNSEIEISRMGGHVCEESSVTQEHTTPAMQPQHGDPRETSGEGGKDQTSTSSFPLNRKAFPTIIHRQAPSQEHALSQDSAFPTFPTSRSATPTSEKALPIGSTHDELSSQQLLANGREKRANQLKLEIFPAPPLLPPPGVRSDAEAGSSSPALSILSAYLPSESSPMLPPRSPLRATPTSSPQPPDRPLPPQRKDSLGSPPQAVATLSGSPDSQVRAGAAGPAPSAPLPRRPRQASIHHFRQPSVSAANRPLHEIGSVRIARKEPPRANQLGKIDTNVAIHSTQPRSASATGNRSDTRLADAPPVPGVGAGIVGMPKSAGDGAERENTLPPLPFLNAESNAPRHTPTESVSSQGSSGTTSSTRSSPASTTSFTSTRKGSEDAVTPITPASSISRRPSKPRHVPMKSFSRPNYAATPADMQPPESPMDPALQNGRLPPIITNTKELPALPTQSQSAVVPPTRNNLPFSPSAVHTPLTAPLKPKQLPLPPTPVTPSAAATNTTNPTTTTTITSVSPLTTVPRRRPVGESSKPACSKASSCRGCSERIRGKSVSSADGRLSGRWHRACFVCHACSAPFPSLDFYVLDDLPFCARHWHERNHSLCAGCDKGIEGPLVEAELEVEGGSEDQNQGGSDRKISPLAPGQTIKEEAEGDADGSGDGRGRGAGQPQQASAARKLAKRKYHPHCFSCSACHRILKDRYFEIAGRILCEQHAFRQDGLVTSSATSAILASALADRASSASGFGASGGGGGGGGGAGAAPFAPGLGAGPGAMASGGFFTGPGGGAAVTAAAQARLPHPEFRSTTRLNVTTVTS